MLVSRENIKTSENIEKQQQRDIYKNRKLYI